MGKNNGFLLYKTLKKPQKVFGIEKRLSFWKRVERELKLKEKIEREKLEMRKQN